MATTYSYEALLVKGTSLSNEELNSLLTLTNENGIPIKKFLDDKTYSTAEGAMAELCKHLNLEFIKDIPTNDIPVDLVQGIPINYAKTHEVLPYKNEKDQILVLSSNPLKHKAIDDLRVFFNKKIRVINTTSAKVQDAINRVYEKSTAALEGLDAIESEEYDLDDPVIDLLEAGNDDAPVIKLVNTLLFRAVKEKASDIHIEPYEKEMVVRFRVDGVLADIFRPPKNFKMPSLPESR